MTLSLFLSDKEIINLNRSSHILVLAKLLPYDPALDRSDPIVFSLAFSLSRTYKRLDELMLEMDPRTTTELIDRYEDICGLPDSCYSDEFQTLTTR